MHSLLTGIKELDKLATGLHPGELAIIAARPGVGKTSLAHTIVQNVAIAQGKGVALFQLESDEITVLMRLLSAQARVDLTCIRSDTTTEHEQARLKQALAKLKQSPLHIFHNIFTLTEIKEKVQQQRVEYPIALTVVDYIQLLKHENQRFGFRSKEIDISADLKRLALELNMPVLAVCQLLPTKTNDDTPRISDLKEWNCLEGEADLFLLLDNKPNLIVEENSGVAKVIVAKQRNGPPAEFRLAWSRGCCRFDNLWKESATRHSVDGQSNQLITPNSFITNLIEEWGTHTTITENTSSASVVDTLKKVASGKRGRSIDLEKKNLERMVK